MICGSGTEAEAGVWTSVLVRPLTITIPVPVGGRMYVVA